MWLDLLKDLEMMNSIMTNPFYHIQKGIDILSNNNRPWILFYHKSPLILHIYSVKILLLYYYKNWNHYPFLMYVSVLDNAEKKCMNEERVLMSKSGSLWIGQKSEQWEQYLSLWLALNLSGSSRKKNWRTEEHVVNFWNSVKVLKKWKMIKS